MSPFTLFNLIDEEDQAKLLEEFSLRVSVNDKYELDKMSKYWKKILNAAIRQTIKFVVHMSKFDRREE